tara:strand:+ start:10918 stop:12792 length:1875 start_codon:yes stop_codon:yes gene_type:complete
MQEKVIIIFDNPDDFDKLLILIKEQHVQIITTNYSTHELLKNKNIEHKISDEFITDDERKNIQKKSYELSDWYNDSEIKNELIYEHVNLGSLIKSEMINILVNFIKKSYEIHKIIQNYENQKFICSETLEKILKLFISDFSIIQKNSKSVEFSPIDSLNVKYSIGFKKYNYEITISKNFFKKLKSISEKISNNLINSNNYHDNKFKYVLFSEFNTFNYRKLLTENVIPFIAYNRRQPAYWNKQTFSLIKNSKIILENENTLSSSSVKKKVIENFSFLEKKIEILFSNNSIFSQIFQTEHFSFWDAIKENFLELFKIRIQENMYEIELTKCLFEKYTFSAIIINNNVGPHEQILSQLGKFFGIQVFLNQHGIIFDTDGSYELNLHQGVLPKNSDISLVWGKIDRMYRENCGIPTKKIIDLGSPQFDDIEKTNPLFDYKDYVVLATSGPTKEKVFDLTIDTIEKNIETIKTVCRITSNLNLNLIIKLHPDPAEYDPSEIAHTINPNIKIIKDGNFSSIIKNAKFVIVIDFSTVILNCHLLNKPVISLPVKNYRVGLPSALTNYSCKCSNLENLEQDIKNLDNDNIRNELIQNGRKNFTNYLSFQNQSGKKFSEFISHLSKGNKLDN